MSAEHHGVHVTALEGAREGCPALQLSGDSRKTFFQLRENSHIFPSTPCMADHLPGSLSTQGQMSPSCERG